MATKIVMEALSPTMEEGRLVEWKKNEGDAVAVGDVLAEVETDKAVMELVARAAGTLLKQLVAAGATVPVSSPVGWIGAAGESVDGRRERRGRTAAAGGRQPGTVAPSQPAPKEPSRCPGARPARPQPAPAAAPPAGTGPTGLTVPPAAPSAESRRRRWRARSPRSTGVDSAGCQGSGPRGPNRQARPRVARRRRAASGRRTARDRPLPTVGPAFTDVPLTQIRKTIAKRLVQSIGPIPTFYLTSEVDMERVAEAREALNAAAGEQGQGLLQRHHPQGGRHGAAAAPGLQRLVAGRPHPRYWNEVHVGMAVAVDDGLITPVIRNADRKRLREISAETRDLAGRARERKLKPEEYTGSTFSVSNLGMFDIEHFTAIINPPGGRHPGGRDGSRRWPVVVGGKVEVRRRMQLTMSCDHRVIDGATGAQFLKTLKMMLENPLALVW